MSAEYEKAPEDVVERYGLNWREDYGSEQVARAVQQTPLPFKEPEYQGSVTAVDPAQAGGVP